MPTLHDPIAFTIAGVSVLWYSIFILTGVIAAVALIRILARRRGMDPEFVLDVAPWVIFGGIVGARLYYIMLRWDYYRANPGDMITLRLAGLTIHGAVVAGALVLALLCWRRRQRVLAWCDVVIPGVALGQAIGRWGNWANQEAFGTPTDLPWAVTIDPERRPAQYVDSATFHPTFLYESLFNLANAVFLSWLVLRMPRSRFLREGDVLWTYFVLYGVARFIIEAVRTDSLYIGPYPAAYWLSAALIAVGAAMLTLRHTVWPGRPAEAEPIAAEDDTMRRAPM